MLPREVKKLQTYSKLIGKISKKIHLLCCVEVVNELLRPTTDSGARRPNKKSIHNDIYKLTTGHNN